MKHKIQVRMDVLEMLQVLVLVFFAGVVSSYDIESHLIYMGLSLLGAADILIKKRVKILTK